MATGKGCHGGLTDWLEMGFSVAVSPVYGLTCVRRRWARIALLPVVLLALPVAVLVGVVLALCCVVAEALETVVR